MGHREHGPNYVGIDYRKYRYMIATAIVAMLLSPYLGKSDVSFILTIGFVATPFLIVLTKELIAIFGEIVRLTRSINRDRNR